MIGEPPEVGPELKQLAQKILVLVDPLVQAAAAVAPSASDGPGECQQVWCPVCAMGALASGEQHPLAAIVAEHGAALLSLIRAMANSDDPGPADEGARAEEFGQRPKAPGRYQPIAITIHE